MNENLLKQYALHILSSLETLHQNNIIHCDVKPQNFLLFTSGQIQNENNLGDIKEEESIDDYEFYEDLPTHNLTLKLSDFGLCHVIPEGEKFAFAKFSIGSHNYKAPELAIVNKFLLNNILLEFLY